MGSITSPTKSLQFRIRPGERRIILLIGDAVMAALALLVALYLWGQRDWLGPSFLQLISERIPPWFFFLPALWLALNIEMYDIRRAGHRADTVKGVAIAAAVSLVIYLAVFFIS